jgi:hypothetical protein
MEFGNDELVLSKQEIVNLISELALSGKPYPLSNGSSIPKKFFTDLEIRFGIPVSHGMESTGAATCSFFNVEWTSECDSSDSPSGGGGTVTKTGLLHILFAVKKGVDKELKD